MGTYINPGNAGFARILNGRYVDKTGIIGLVNEVVDTAQAFVCVTRPPRFGKLYQWLRMRLRTLPLSWAGAREAPVNYSFRGAYASRLRE